MYFVHRYWPFSSSGGATHYTFNFPSGTYTYILTSASYTYGRKFLFGSNTYSFTLTTASLSYGRTLAFGNNTYSFTTTPASFKVKLSEVFPSGTYNYNPSTAIFIYSPGGRLVTGGRQVFDAELALASQNWHKRQLEANPNALYNLSNQIRKEHSEAASRLGRLGAQARWSK